MRFPYVPIDDDMEICEINAKVRLGLNPNQRLYKPVPKTPKNIAVNRQNHVEIVLLLWPTNWLT